MNRPKVLCVDDDSDVLEGLEQHLISAFDVNLATSAAAGLELAAEAGPFAVVLSDMRMPGMNGAVFLAKLRELYPDTVRMLLTGYSDMESAALAVNEGQIFRFLTKPCSAEQIRSCFRTASEQYRLLTAEKDLLERTLKGSVQALIDTLALTKPLAFGRANRIHKHVTLMCEALGLAERWSLEIAALVSELGAVSLPDELLEKVYFGIPLSVQEQKQQQELPKITRRLLERIPRLEPVVELLDAYDRFRQKGGQPASQGVALLQIAFDFEALEASGLEPPNAIATMCGRSKRYDEPSLNAFAKQIGSVSTTRKVREIPVLGVKAGMVFAEDVRTTDGALLAARGYEVTASFEARVPSFRRGYVKEPVRVIFSRKDSV